MVLKHACTAKCNVRQLIANRQLIYSLLVKPSHATKRLMYADFVHGVTFLLKIGDRFIFRSISYIHVPAMDRNEPVSPSDRLCK